MTARWVPFTDVAVFVLSLQRAKMSDFDRYKVMKAKRMVSARPAAT